MTIFEKLIKRFPEKKEFIIGLKELGASKIKLERVKDKYLDYDNYWINFFIGSYKYTCVLDREETFLELEASPTLDIDLAEDISHKNVIKILKLMKGEEV